MDEYTRFLYRLLHHRDFRRRFIAGDVGGLGISPELLEDASVIDKRDLERSAQKVVLTARAIAHKHHPRSLARWKELVPADEHCFELMFLFVASEDYEAASNFDTSGRDTSIPDAFSRFYSRLVTAP